MVWTTVQELAAAVEEPPRQYLVHEQDQGLLAADQMPEPIPLIDLSRLTADDEADKLRAALQTWGLFLIRTLPPRATQSDASAQLGVVTMAMKKHGDRPPPSARRCICMLKLLNSSCNCLTLHQHPAHDGDVLLEYASRTKRIRDLVFQSIAKILDLEEDYFLNQISNKDPGFARFNYYPPCPRPDLVLGMRPHSDGGLLTIVFVDHDVGGLQVERDGKWYNVPAKPYSLVINLADCMEIMCNGIFRSPVHRVVTNAEKERLSLAVFYAVDGETMLEPAPGLLDDRRPPRYGKFKAKDFGLSLD
uniref:Fe2OG dioxygenase domain-containing protein n=1 Tax=Hordeum vulgare subsp. vulgare TaxID=112509 RepID=A0A8I6Y8H6_HORVV